MIHSQKITTSSCSAAASAAVAVTEMDVGFVDRAAVEMFFFFFFLKNHFRYIGVTDFYDWCLFSNSRL